MQKTRNLGIAEAAARLGITQQGLRCGLRANKPPLNQIGYAICRNGKGKRYEYVIFEAVLDRYLAKEVTTMAKEKPLHERGRC